MSERTSSLMPLRIYLTTWNVMTKQPTENLNNLFGITKNSVRSELPDIYAIGLQEVCARPQALILDVLFLDPWTRAIRDVLIEWDYVKIRSVRLQGLILLVYIKREHLVFLRGIQTAYTRTGLGGVWGNKGGVTIRLSAFGSSICIVNCHLAAHEHELKQRIEDFNAIVDGQVFKDPETENILFHDYIFWIGDLNFRLDDLSSIDIINATEKKDYALLLEKDQLRKVMQSGEAFSEFAESLPTFPPTYKFIVGSDEYDSNRRPGWTDRILYKVNSNVYDYVTLDLTQEWYNSHKCYRLSDHKPVSSLFTLKVFDAVPIKPVRFAKISQWYMGQSNTADFFLPSEHQPSAADWIGLYKADFCSLDEYVAYDWVTDKHQIESPDQDRSYSTGTPSLSTLTISPQPSNNEPTHPHANLLLNSNRWSIPEVQVSAQTLPTIRSDELLNLKSEEDWEKKKHGSTHFKVTQVDEASVPSSSKDASCKMKEGAECSGAKKITHSFRSSPQNILRAVSHWLTFSSQTRYRITFPEQTLSAPGLYCLIYLSQDLSNVHGMSDPFKILPSQLHR